MNRFLEAKERIIHEKLDILTSWISTSIDGDEKFINSSLLTSDGVLSEQAKRFLLTDERFTDSHQLEIPIAQRLIEDAYHRELDYLATPQSFLTQYLFTTEQTSAISKLNNLTAYEYYRVILSEMTNYSNDDSFTLSDIQLIDNTLMFHATLSSVTELLDELYSFVRYRGNDPFLESEILIAFFNDKEMPSVSDAIAATHLNTLRIKEVIDVLSALLVKSEPVVHLDEIIPVNDIGYVNVSVSKYDEFVDELKVVGVDVTASREVHIKNTLLPYEFFLTKKNQERILNQIFYGHRKQFQSFIDTINASKSKDVALINIDTTLELQRVTKKSKPVRKIYEAIDKRYSE